MSERQPGADSELSELLEAAVERLAPLRRTFTDDDALGTIWAAGYDIGPQYDPRFVLVQEGRGAKRPRHWRLMSHTVANNLLLESSLNGTWNGQDVDAELARLDHRLGGHHVFSPFDPRFLARSDGRVEPSEREQQGELDATTKAELDTYAPRLRDEWRSAGNAPRTLRQIMDALRDLGWVGANVRGAMIPVRLWLRDLSLVQRAGLDYWVPANALPAAPERVRLQVLPVRLATHNTPAASADEAPVGEEEPPLDGAQTAEGEIPKSESHEGRSLVTWTHIVRTIHLLEGVLPIPATGRAAIPPQAPGAERWEIVQGTWFDSGDKLWLWIDRQNFRLCGADLQSQLAWCDAGQRLRITWAPEGIILRTAGVDLDVQKQETRLVDLETLATLRGGLGESYRQSLMAILRAAPQGLTFPEVVTALRERQGHETHRGTIRAVLSAGGFLCRDGRWFVPPDGENSSRRLRAAMVRTLVSTPESADPVVQQDAGTGLQATALAIHERLRQLATILRRE